MNVSPGTRTPAAVNQAGTNASTPRVGTPRWSRGVNSPPPARREEAAEGPGAHPSRGAARGGGKPGDLGGPDPHARGVGGKEEDPAVAGGAQHPRPPYRAPRVARLLRQRGGALEPAEREDRVD